MNRWYDFRVVLLSVCFMSRVDYVRDVHQLPKQVEVLLS